MDNKQVLVFYADYIPESIISEFTESCRLSGIHNVETKVREISNLNFGGRLDDIVIFLKDKSGEIITKLLTGFASDIVKVAIKSIWKSLKSIKIKKVIGGKVTEETTAKISVCVGNDKEFIEIVIDSNIKVDSVDELITSLDKLLALPRLNEYFNNSAYLENKSDKPKYRIKYNEETKDWEFVNFDKLREAIERVRIENSRKYRN